MKKIKNINRRKFFVSAGLSALGVSLIGKSALKILPGTSGSKLKNENISLKINPSAVMRNKKA